MAHKKGQGSSRNGRDSPGQHRGVKVYGGQVTKPGVILVRQCGTVFHPGTNVGMGKDYTIFSKIDGVVKYERFGKDRQKISVYSKEELAKLDALKALRAAQAANGAKGAQAKA